MLLEAARALWPDQDATGFNYFDFVHARASPRVALFYSGLFWPDFVEFHGMVFLADALEDQSDRDRVMTALREYGNDSLKTEQDFNTIEIPALFGGRCAETSDEEDVVLAQQIRAIWAARLAELFPDRRFVVTVVPPGESEEIAVQFYQVGPVEGAG